MADPALPLALSLSHCGTLAACAVTEEADAVGVDLERIDPRNADLLPRICCRQEAHPPYRATLVWAAKEAAMKACRARSPRMRDYRLTSAATSPLIISPAWQPDRELRGWPRQVAGHVLVVAGRRLSEPALTLLKPHDVLVALERAS